VFNPTQICNTQSLTWTANFRFGSSDCRGSSGSAAFLRPIRSNFKLQPDSSAQAPLVFDVMENAAYVDCSGTSSEFRSVPTPTSSIEAPKPAPQPAPQPSQQGDLASQQAQLQLFQQQLLQQQSLWQQQLQMQQQQWDRLQQQQQKQWESQQQLQVQRQQQQLQLQMQQPQQQQQVSRATAFQPRTTQWNVAPRITVAPEDRPVPVQRQVPKPAPAKALQPAKLSWQGVTYQRSTVFTW
jgi:hypothetical protein